MLDMKRFVRRALRLDPFFLLAFAYVLALESSGSQPTVSTAKSAEAPVIPAGVRAV